MSLTSDELLSLAKTAIEDTKGQDLECLDVRDKTVITDWMLVVSGTSTRHVKTIAETIALKSKQAGHPAMGIEGLESAEWVLVDLGDILVHVMLPKTREFYNLEKLWSEFARPEQDTEIQH
ncbi:MAG: ribosome silencing factor [bacterium]